MPTKLKRYTVNLPTDVQELVERDALLNRRHVANQIVVCLEEYYIFRKKEADLFNHPQLREARRSADVPVYETPPIDQRQAEQVSKIREKLGRE